MKANRPIIGRALDGVLRLVVGGVFAFAGGLKMADPAQFALNVANYRLVPHEWTHLVAILVPGIEVAAGFLVLAGIWLRPAALVVLSMTGMFFFVIVSALARGLNIECGCFGTVGGRHVGLVNLAIDIVLLSLSALLMVRSGNRAGKEIRDRDERIGRDPAECDLERRGPRQAG